jgi:quinol monooxygenase YgiN
MVIVIIKMDVQPEKSLEFKQTLLALLEPMGKEKGCLSRHIYQDTENDNAISMIQMWQSRKDFDEHLRSDTFTLLIGSRYLLSRPQEIAINEVPVPSGWQALETVAKSINRVGLNLSD